MATLASLLPAPQRVLEQQDDEEDYMETSAVSSTAGGREPRFIPPYGQRASGWKPVTNEDYGDGGAFPEIHLAQYPLDMGRKRAGAGDPSTALILASQLDADGKPEYHKIAEYGRRAGEIVYSRYKDLVPSAADTTEEQLARPDAETVEEVTERTKAALNRILDVKLSAKTTGGAVQKKAEPTYIKYTPSVQGGGHNSGANQRIIRVVDTAQDPLEPPKFRNKKMVRAAPDAPVPILHSPPRKLTQADMANWKIPPCISNWKNAKGFTIALDKRMAADGRSMQDHSINDNFAKLSEALFIAERNARDEIDKRARIRQAALLKQKQEKEEELRKLALHAREERTSIAEAVQPDEVDELREREEIREERKRERERDRRMENAGKKTKMMRDRERDVSEKIALGQMPKGMQPEAVYDQRLFNQTEGLGHGFRNDDDYNVYDKPLFQGSSAANVYRPRKGDGETYGEDPDKILKTARFQPDRGFAGTEQAANAPNQPRSGPVEFEMHKGDTTHTQQPQEEDPFGIEAFLQEAKSSKKK